MYDVLLVDDEVNILEGIAKMVDWSGCDTRLQGKASNGLIAFEMIKKSPPDIVITDIKMPGMSGVELIEKVYYLLPETQFIVLSGYNEFEYAKTAMRYGAKHYLLKPSNENKIQEALSQVVQELTERKEKDLFLEEMNLSLEKVIPKAKEQLLREFITNKKYGLKEWEYYQELFRLPPTSQQFRLTVFALDDSHEYEHLFALREIITKELGNRQVVLLSTILLDRVVLLTEGVGREELFEKVKALKETYKNFYSATFTTAISSLGTIADLRMLYHETLDCLNQKFYIGNGGIITSNDIYNGEYRLEELQFDHEDLAFAVRSGNMDETNRYLKEFFVKIKDTKYDVNIVRSHCLELFMLLIRQTKKDVMNKLFTQIAFFKDFSTLDEIQTFIVKVSREITELNYKAKKQTQHALINELEEYAVTHVHEGSLSITKIANEVFFMNSDYLGKLFKKETGEKFSIYLMKLRMEKAIEFIQQSDEVMVLEVAEKVGLGNNPRYFSQVFKKHTGYTPTEYKSIVS